MSSTTFLLADQERNGPNTNSLGGPSVSVDSTLDVSAQKTQVLLCLIQAFCRLMAGGKTADIGLL